MYMYRCGMGPSLKLSHGQLALQRSANAANWPIESPSRSQVTPSAPPPPGQSASSKATPQPPAARNPRRASGRLCLCAFGACWDWRRPSVRRTGSQATARGGICNQLLNTALAVRLGLWGRSCVEGIEHSEQGAALLVILPAAPVLSKRREEISP